MIIKLELIFLDKLDKIEKLREHIMLVDTAVALSILWRFSQGRVQYLKFLGIVRVFWQL